MPEKTPLRRQAHHKLEELRESVDIATQDYISTSPLCSYIVKGKQVPMDIRDLLLMEAITESDILLTGKPAVAKPAWRVVL